MGTVRQEVMQEVIRAIEAVTAAVRRHAVVHPVDTQRTIRGIEQVASTMCMRGANEAARLKDRIDRRLIPLADPLTLSWNVFQLFQVEYDEPRWTKWIAAVLSPKRGKRASRVLWRAFCAVAAKEADRCPPERVADKLILADAALWREAVEVQEVQPEYGMEDLGRVDLLIEANSLTAVVENKLWEGWHDRTGEKSQAERYREIAQNLMKKRPPLTVAGLVLLTCHRGLVRGKHYPDDYICLTWRDLGRELRRALHRELRQNSTPADMLELWPLVLTLASIEQDLLGLRYSPTEGEPTWDRIRHLLDLEAYLCTEDTNAR